MNMFDEEKGFLFHANVTNIEEEDSITEKSGNIMSPTLTLTFVGVQKVCSNIQYFVPIFDQNEQKFKRFDFFAAPDKFK